MLRIFDVHTHVYPDSIARKAVKSIGDFYDSSIEMDGTVDCLLSAKEEAGIDRCVIHSVAVIPKYVKHINDFLIQQVSRHPDSMIGFGSMHPDLEGISQELERLLAAGFKGVKLHPDFQQFYLDEAKSIEMFQRIAERNLPVLIHIGDPVHPYSSPLRMARLLDKVPQLRAICAHLGGWSCWREGLKALAGRENVWIDTSSSLYMMEPEEAVEIIHQYGVEKAFFGSDYPMWRPSGELKRFMKLPLTMEEREKILHRNLEAFLGMEEI